MCGDCVNAMVRLGAAYGAGGYDEDDEAALIFEAVGGYERILSINPDRMTPANEENPVRGGRG